MHALISESEKHNIWTLQAVIFPENIGSIKIHEASGFRVIGKRERIGKMNGVWRDIICLKGEAMLWELIKRILLMKKKLLFVVLRTVLVRR